jgi:hypothetical protein
MVPRLIVAGHGAEQALAWATTVPAFTKAEPEAVRAVASLLTARWVSRAAAEGGVWLALADAGRAWIESSLAIAR